MLKITGENSINKSAYRQKKTMSRPNFGHHVLTTDNKGEKIYTINLPNAPKGAEIELMPFYYNENCNASICLKNGYINTSCLRGYRRYKKINSDMLYLKIIKHDDVLTYYFSEDGLQFTKTETSDEVSGFHHNVFKGFLSLSPGIYATGGCIAKCKKLTLKFL